MRTMHRWALPGLWLALAACDAGPTGPADPAAIKPAFGVEPVPFRVFDFGAAGQIDGRWVGRLGNGGSLTVEPLRAQSMGATWGLVQEWTFQAPPDDDAPVTATLFGIIDLANGNLVLNGATADGGVVHVQGGVVASEGGAISVGGYVSFNPQPEPPGHL